MILLVDAAPGEWRVTACDALGPLDFALIRPGAPDGVGDVFRGRVIARVPAMAGAFIALPNAEGFLPDSAGAATLSNGAAVTVRITRAGQGGKGPRLAAESQATPAGPPALLRRGPSALDILAARFPDAPIRVNSQAALAVLRPRYGARADLAVSPLLDDAGHAALDALTRQDAALPGGMRACFHPTPALTAIDMDLGAGTAARGSKTRTLLEANRAALPALARQIRLRNLSGAILIDLAGLSVPRRSALADDLAAALAPDPVGPRLLGFTRLGFAEITRPRGAPPLHELLATPHAAGLAALRQAAAESAARPHLALALRAAPSVADALHADSLALAELTAQTGRAMPILRDATLSPLSWTLEPALHA